MSYRLAHACRTDENQKDIVETLRGIGATVELLHKVGGGCPDILVGYKGLNWLFEIKDPRHIPSQRKLNDVQVQWHAAWRGQVNKIETAAEAMEIMQVEFATVETP
jgi:hypothetical protein